MARMGIILVMVLLLSAAAHTEPARSPVEEGNEKAIPCPVEADIYPCTCTVLPDYETDLDCSAVTSSDELARVFSAHFPIPEFNKLIINNNLYLTTIRDGDLGNEVTFRYIYIEHGILTTIQANAFAASYSTLQILSLYDNQIVSFPFEQIFMFTQLTQLSMRTNNLGYFPIMSSSSLISLVFSYNPIRMISAAAFDQLTRLEYIYLYDCELQELFPGTFSGMPYLHYIDLRQNYLQSIAAGTFQLTTSNNYIDLDYNSISSVDVNGFLGATGVLWMWGNQLTTLAEDVWKPLFTGSFMLYPLYNPLGCECDMAWLILSDTLMSHLDSGTTCSNGELVHELPKEVYERCP